MVLQRPSSISPGTFTSDLDVQKDNSHQDVIFSQSSSGAAINDWAPSPLEYHVILSKIANIIHTHSRSTFKASPKGVWEVLRKLDKISEGLPNHLKSSEIPNLGSQNNHSHMHWTLIQRGSLNSLLQACRVNLCFSNLSRLLETGEDEFSLQDCGHQAATRLVETQQWTQTSTGNKLWGTTASLMAAGMFLLLDLICFINSKSDTQVASQLETINLSIQMLEGASTSRIDGSVVLKRLLHLQNIGFAGQAVDRQMLLAIMKHASIPVVKSVALDTVRGSHSNSSTQAKGLADPLEGIPNPSDNCMYSGPATDQAFPFAAFGEPFDAGFGMDLDYMNFDMEQILPSIDFSEGELSIF